MSTDMIYTTNRVNWYTWETAVVDPYGSTIWYFNAFTRNGSLKKAETFFKEYNNDQGQ